jgi:3-(methylthio)propanoyl-CoA dehydrogenase
MLTYQPPLRDIQFSLDLVGMDAVAKLSAFAHADRETVASLLEEVGRLASEVFAPTNATGDREGLKVDTATSTITTPTGFKEAYRQYVDGGWGSVPADANYGGGGFPHLVGIAMGEMLQSANMALALCPMLTQGSIDALLHWGSETQRETFLPKLVSGEWTGTMNLSEPDAGSDVGALRAKAVQAADGTWGITGQKIYITWGEHDMSSNIIHLVLARVEGAPAGTKGISCFIVPKYLVNADGSLGARNDVKVVSTEHKMGIHASPTCVLAFGDDGEGAVGELIGELNSGMKTMFTMMNNARLAVGQQGVALAELAYQIAYDHSMNRVQGRVTGSDEDSSIIGHADVRRMLLTMRSQIEAMRHLIFLNAKAIDDSRHGDGADTRTRATELADLLTPLSKAWCTDLGNELASIGVQIGGGMGFCEDTGAAQVFRDIRIAAIYEGTNGIQALDLFGRKLPMRNGEVIAALFAEMSLVLPELEASPLTADLAKPLGAALSEVRTLTEWMLTEGRTNVADGMAGATPYLRVLSTLVGGWLMARQAVLAASSTSASATDSFFSAKVATARFYLTQILPTVEGLYEQVRATSAPLYSIPAAALASS